MKKKIYVGGSFTNASYEFRLEIEKFKETLRKKYHVMDFFGIKNDSPTEAYKWTMECVKECDLFIAICDYPSLGLGYEIKTRLEHNKKMIAVARKDFQVGRIILGIRDKNFIFKRYKNSLEEVKKHIKI